MKDLSRGNPAIMATLRELLAEMETLSADFSPVVQEAVRDAKNHELDPVSAERIYSKILTVLRSSTGHLDERDIADEVRRLLAGPTEGKPWGSVPLVARNGLEPHLVQPVPTFNNLAVPMWEGYVDVMTLDLWKGNHRVELQLAEFREVHHREPDDDELLDLMQGGLHLPSLSKKDPFKIEILAKSIARKGVERPPIVTSEREPKDGNRRIAASKSVVNSRNFTAEEKERARWIKVWVAPPGTTDDQFEAIVVALNFEDDLKEKWPEFVKGRLVVDEYRKARNDVRGSFTPTHERALRKRIAEHFAITTNEVTRYLRMVQWSEDFESYHVDDHGRDAAAVRYRADDIFQWFYEIQAGKSADKITNQMDEDEDLRRIVYDLMFEVMDAGTQVRSLWKIVADPEARKQLETAHDQLERKDKIGALGLVKEAVTTADRNTATRKKIGFESFLRNCTERLGAAPPDNWRTLDSELLKDLERVFVASNGVIEAELVARGERAIAVNA